MHEPPPLAVKSADRVLDLFELLARGGREMSHAEIAAALEIPKSSLTQLLRNLVARGYVAFSAASKGYRLGEAFAALARQGGPQLDLVARAAPVLAEITAQTRESSALNRMTGDEAEVVATVSSPQRLISHMRLGDLAPLHATSGGQAILAHLPAPALEAYLGRAVLRAVTPATLVDPAALRARLAAARREGFACTFEEYTPGIVGIARPVLDAAGMPLASLNVAIPVVRNSPATRDAAMAALRAGVERLQAGF
jgi:DNA-binding IclR family transcriptional regulator